MKHAKRILSAAGFIAVGFVLALAVPHGLAAPVPLRDTHENLHAGLWMQTAAEYQAIARGTYARATQQLDALLPLSQTAALEQTGPIPAKPAIIMDLDETVIDNMRFQGRLILDRTPYSGAMWQKWIETASATAIPGAIEFIRHAQDKGVRVFYVTNRTKEQREKTRENLIKLGMAFPQDEETLLTRDDSIQWGSDKTSRRKFVADKYRVVMLVGDDLNDFVPARLTPEQRVELAVKHAGHWLNDWFLLPNAQYGSWEGALYEHNFSMPDKDVLARKLSLVHSFP